MMLSMRTLPYLTAGTPPVTATYKARWEDFRVTEIPALEPEGRGDHTWIEIEKHGLTTATAAADLARALGVKPSSVGYSGLKDTRAIARQWMSVEHVDPARLAAFDLPRLTVLRAERHPRKLRRGWHAGNRFQILLRDCSSQSGDPASAVRQSLAILARRGVPNYYGPQRFGYRGDTWLVGRALARGEWGEAAALIAGRPLRPGDAAIDPASGVYADRDEILRARELFDRGEYGEAAATWPRGYGQCARLAAAMERTGGDADRALRVVGKGMLRLYASAYQAWLFNRVLGCRIDWIDSLLAGDLAWKHDTEALYRVEDPEGEQDRVDRFEVSPTGPLVGKRMREAEGAAGDLEARALRESGFDPAELKSAALRPLTGRRRPLRFPLADTAVQAGVDGHGPYLELGFTLPPGCYATAVLRELGKGRIAERGTPVALDPGP
jgi:tRNA pseudouridine13 synthase